MNFEPEQEELLIWMVESSRDIDRAERRWFLALIDGPSSLHGPGGIRQLPETDLYALADAGLLRPSPDGREFTITGDGYAYYAVLKQREGEPVARQEAEVRRLIDSEEFRRAFPAAYGLWAEAEGFLWKPDADEGDFTTIGHKVREGMQ